MNITRKELDALKAELAVHEVQLECLQRLIAELGNDLARIENRGETRINDLSTTLRHVINRMAVGRRVA